MCIRDSYVPDTQTHIWLAPGGGIESGEEPLAALKREVWEETGYQEDDPTIHGPVWHRRHAFVFRGEDFDQEELYYLWPVSRFAATGEGNPAVHEQELVDQLRWWHLDEICTSDEIFVPLKMAKYLRQLLTEVPEFPLEVGL